MQFLAHTLGRGNVWGGGKSLQLHTKHNNKSKTKLQLITKFYKQNYRTNFSQLFTLPLLRQQGVLVDYLKTLKVQEMETEYPAEPLAQDPT